MVAGTYDVALKTPMGVKKGTLVLEEADGKLSGQIRVMNRENDIAEGSVKGDAFSFSGKLKTAVGVTAYTCTGTVQADTMQGNVNTARGVMQLTGTRQ
ncbi:MAG: hypothetical protein ACI4OJ_13525 [Lachnospiraceae bacterium]